MPSALPSLAAAVITTTKDRFRRPECHAGQQAIHHMRMRLPWKPGTRVMDAFCERFVTGVGYIRAARRGDLLRRLSFDTQSKCAGHPHIWTNHDTSRSI